MIKAKLLAMCVCPVLATPPAVLAVHRPARHAVAHLLHHVARRLDGAAVVAVTASPVAAALPCAPSLAAGSGGGLPVVGGGVLAGGGQALAVTDGPGFTYDGHGNGGGSGYGGSVGGGGFGGGGAGGGCPAGIGPYSGTPSGGGAVGDPGSMPISSTPLPVGGSGLIPAPMPVATPPVVSGAPEPAAWLFLVTGFGLVGAIARTARFRAGPLLRAAD